MATFEVIIDNAIYEVDAPDENTAWAWANASHKPQAPQAQPPQQGDGFVQGLGNLAAGAIRGAGSIGATILSPVDAAARAMGIQNSFIGRDDRRAAMDEGLRAMGANPESGLYTAGKIGAEIAGTAGVGGALAKGAVAIPAVANAVPSLAAALRSGGFSLGGQGGNAIANAATRLGAGAAVGGASAGLIDPEYAGTGAMLGAALPAAVKVAGGTGRALKAGLYDPIMRKDRVISGALMSLLGRDGADDAARAMGTTAQTPGVRYSAGQASGNERLLALEDSLREVQNIGGPLGTQARINKKTLADTLRNIAQDDAAMTAARDARSQVAQDAFGKVRDKVYVVNDDLSKLLARGRADNITREAQKAAIRRGDKFSLPVIEEMQRAGFRNADEAERALYGGMPDPGTFTYGGGVPDDIPVSETSGLLAKIRKLGGVSTKDMADLVGERATNKSGAQVGVFTKKGEEVGDMVRRLVDAGYMPKQVLNDVDGGAQALRDAIMSELSGESDDMAARLAAKYYGEPEVLPLARETLMKPAGPFIPEDKVIGQAIKGQDLQSIKEGIDAAIGKAKSAGDGGAVKSLRTLKDEYMAWLGQQDDAFITANKQYADLSRPINQMQVGRKLSDLLIPPTSGDIPTRLNASQLAKALRNPDALAQNATGFSGAKMANIMDADQLNAIRGVSTDASRIAEANALGAGGNSATARRLKGGEFIGASFAQRAPFLSSLFENISSVPGLGIATKGLSAAGGFVGKGINAKIVHQLDDMLANDPIGVAKMLQRELSSLNAAEREAVLKIIPKSTLISAGVVMTNQ